MVNEAYSYTFNFQCDHTQKLCELQVTVPVSSVIHSPKILAKTFVQLVMWTVALPGI